MSSRHRPKRAEGVTPGSSVLPPHLPGPEGALSTPGCLRAGMGCPVGCSPHSHPVVGGQKVTPQIRWGALVPPAPAGPCGGPWPGATVPSCSSPSLMHAPPLHHVQEPPSPAWGLPVSPCPHSVPTQGCWPRTCHPRSLCVPSVPFIPSSPCFMLLLRVFNGLEVK